MIGGVELAVVIMAIIAIIAVVIDAITSPQEDE